MDPDFIVGRHGLHDFFDPLDVIVVEFHISVLEFVGKLEVFNEILFVLDGDVFLKCADYGHIGFHELT